MSSPKINRRKRTFARWLQRRVVFVSDDGARCEPETALGPDRQLIPIPKGPPLEGCFEIFAKDARTLLGKSGHVKVSSGAGFRLEHTR